MATGRTFAPVGLGDDLSWVSPREEYESALQGIQPLSLGRWAPDMAPPIQGRGRTFAPVPFADAPPMESPYPQEVPRTFPPEYLSPRDVPMATRLDAMERSMRTPLATRSDPAYLAYRLAQLGLYASRDPRTAVLYSMMPQVEPPGELGRTFDRWVKPLETVAPVVSWLRMKPIVTNPKNARNDTWEYLKQWWEHPPWRGYPNPREHPVPAPKWIPEPYTGKGLTVDEMAMRHWEKYGRARGDPMPIPQGEPPPLRGTGVNPKPLPYRPITESIPSPSRDPVDRARRVGPPLIPSLPAEPMPRPRLDMPMPPTPAEKAQVRAQLKRMQDITGTGPDGPFKIPPDYQ